jgi:hypothetical protein
MSISIDISTVPVWRSTVIQWHALQCLQLALIVDICRLFKGMQVTRTANFFEYQWGDNYICIRLEFTVDARYFSTYYLSPTEVDEPVQREREREGALKTKLWSVRVMASHSEGVL